MTPEEISLLQAAASWARALEAQAVASEDMIGEEAAQELLKEAEVELYVAVLGWRGLRS